MACHQVNGAGIPPVFPALAGSEIVMNDKGRQVEILMEGVQGAAMQSYAEQLTEVEIAAVITYTGVGNHCCNFYFGKLFCIRLHRCSLNPFH